MDLEGLLLDSAPLSAEPAPAPAGNKIEASTARPRCWTRLTPNRARRSARSRRSRFSGSGGRSRTDDGARSQAIRTALGAESPGDEALRERVRHGPSRENPGRQPGGAGHARAMDSPCDPLASARRLSRKHIQAADRLLGSSDPGDAYPDALKLLIESGVPGSVMGFPHGGPLTQEIVERCTGRRSRRLPDRLANRLSTSEGAPGLARSCRLISRKRLGCQASIGWRRTRRWTLAVELVGPMLAVLGARGSGGDDRTVSGLLYGRWLRGCPECRLFGPEGSISGPYPSESGTRGDPKSKVELSSFCKLTGVAARGRSPHTRGVAGSNPATPIKLANAGGFPCRPRCPARQVSGRSVLADP